MSIQHMLFDLQDKEYAVFQSKLTPNIPKEKFIGVRIPKARILAKTIINKESVEEFIYDLPHYYYDENILQALLVSEFADYDRCIKEVNRFLPYIDNWAVCDVMRPKVFKKNREKLIKNIKEWANSKHTYTCRFGLEMLMCHYLDDNFLPEYLEIPQAVYSKEYYVQMMIAWFFATALAKQWEATIPYLIEHRINPQAHNKTIQKACESKRITNEQKEYLKTLKR